MPKYFGTDGVRGKFGAPHMCPEFAYRLAKALGRYLQKYRPSEKLSVVIGRDTRSSGEALVEALAAGFNEHVVIVFDGGVVPTPAVAMSVIEQNADLGIAVTASHNPAHDNGIKLFDSDGCKLDEDQECLIESLLEEEPRSYGDLPVARTVSLDCSVTYVNKLRLLLDRNSLKGWKIVLDTANGATFKTSPEVIRWWGADVYLLGDDPDGTNINEDVGSECPDLLAQTVLEQGANIGIAHDGDGDRLVVCDETGNVVDGDVLLALLGVYAKKANELKADCLVATVHSNLGLDRALEGAGGRIDRIGTDHR